MRSIHEVILTVLCIPSVASAFSLILPGPFAQSKRNELKTKLLDLASETKRGINQTPEQREEIRQLFEDLERLNPTKGPLASDKVNGDWSLDYSTSESIIGKGGFPRIGPIVQKIDTKSLSAENSEVVSYFGVKVPRKITAELKPENNQFTNVQFKRFVLGPIEFDAPEKFKGSLDVTYLDDELRLTRGDKGNIFVLTRLGDL
uniref:Plastid lipid-associated protein/fibrillin conserved domain-containing protein n=1 Tax=Ditylum brightwellii TaxID=49249 RepID=A0A6S9BVI7_9STRA|mmetsp:Transcript_9391/g.12616  ORF Transcript_9391/g.12616 Transcript_9391/m.12616 type:complete len:203 (+) Transcript_9391:56-664(+)